MTCHSAPLDLYANAECVILIANGEGSVVWANSRASALTGYTEEELRGCAVRDLIPGAHELQRRSRTSRDDTLVGAVRFESVLQSRDGGKIDVAVFARPVEWNGETSATLIRARDIRRESDLRKRLRSEVRRAALSRERERKRIARIVHDEILNGLLDIAMLLPDVEHDDAPGQAVLNRETIGLLREQLDSCIQSVRLLSSRLRDDKPEDVDLVSLLTVMTRKQSADAPAIDVAVVGASPRMSREATYLITGVVQEALRNIERHSRASAVRIRLAFSPDSLELEIADNGTGFDAPEDEHDAASRGALGLLGLYERATLLGGTLHMASSANTGTSVRLRVPISAVSETAL